MFWRWPHLYLEECRRRYGTTFTIRPTGMPPLVFMADPEHIKAIVTAPADVLHPGAGAAVITPLVGERSFMLAEEQAHLTGRKAIMPAFHHRAIEEHTQMVQEIVQQELARWPLDTPFTSHEYLRALSLKVILRTLFGKDRVRLAELHRELLAMLKITGSLALQEPLLRHLPGWRSNWREFLIHRARVDGLLQAVTEDEPGDRDSTLLGMLLEARNADGTPMTMRQVHDNLMSVILAGHETTASELAWAFQLLAHNHRVHHRLVSALDGGDETYLTATVKEVLRHRPVFLFTIPRVVHRPLQIGAWTYRSPAHLLGCIHLMHHDPRIYADPDAFKPERFLDGTTEVGHWLPWGGGRKHCPGRHLAILEMHVVLRTVLAQRSLKPAGRMEEARWRTVIVTPGKGSQIVLNKRRSGAATVRGPI
jgi:cytochrome P450